MYTTYEDEAAKALDAVERCIEHLRHAFTAKGVMQWFERPRYQLGERTPLEAINDGDYEEVVLLAEGSRESGGT